MSIIVDDAQAIPTVTGSLDKSVKTACGGRSTPDAPWTVEPSEQMSRSRHPKTQLMYYEPLPEQATAPGLVLRRPADRFSCSLARLGQKNIPPILDLLCARLGPKPGEA